MPDIFPRNWNLFFYYAPEEFCMLDSGWTITLFMLDEEHVVYSVKVEKPRVSRCNFWISSQRSLREFFLLWGLQEIDGMLLMQIYKQVQRKLTYQNALKIMFSLHTLYLLQTDIPERTVCLYEQNRRWESSVKGIEIRLWTPRCNFQLCYSRNTHYLADSSESAAFIGMGIFWEFRFVYFQLHIHLYF